MRNRLLALLILAGLSLPVGSRAQSVGHDLENAFKDILYIWSAPGRIDRDALPYIGGVLGATAAFLPLDRPIYDWLSTHQKSLPGRLLGVVGEDSPLNLVGRSFILVPTSLTLYTAGWIFDSSDLRQAGMGCISANMATTLSRRAIGFLIGRLRPRYDKGPFVIEPFLFTKGTWEMRSFPGGHGAHIMSCVSFWANRFDLGLAEPALYVLATGAAWARVMDGAHWPSDTVFGQLYGWAIGKGVADRYLQRNEGNTTDEASRKPGIGFIVRIPL